MKYFLLSLTIALSTQAMASRWIELKDDSPIHSYFFSNQLPSNALIVQMVHPLKFETSRLKELGSREEFESTSIYLQNGQWLPKKTVTTKNSIFCQFQTTQMLVDYNDRSKLQDILIDSSMRVKNFNSLGARIHLLGFDPNEKPSIATSAAMIFHNTTHGRSDTIALTVHKHVGVNPQWSDLNIKVSDIKSCFGKENIKLYQVLGEPY